MPREYSPKCQALSNQALRLQAQKSQAPRSPLNSMILGVKAPDMLALKCEASRLRNRVRNLRSCKVRGEREEYSNDYV